jgi:hypothetical protein
MLLDYDALQQKNLPGATVLYDGGQFEIAIRLEDLLLCWQLRFAPGSLKDKSIRLF